MWKESRLPLLGTIAGLLDKSILQHFVNNGNHRIKDVKALETFYRSKSFQLPHMNEPAISFQNCLEVQRFTR